MLAMGGHKVIVTKYKGIVLNLMLNYDLSTITFQPDHSMVKTDI